MAGPSLSGPLTGWTANTLVPRTVEAVARSPRAPSIFDRFQATPEQRQERYDIAKKAADAAEEAARLSGDPRKLQEAYDLFLKSESLKDRPEGGSALEIFRDSVETFRSRNPSVQVTPETLRILNAPRESLQGAVLGSGDPTAVSAAQPARGGSSASAYDLSEDDFGSGLPPNLRPASKPLTPLESLLRAIYPEESQGTPVNPLLADPRNPAQSSVIENVLSNLAVNQQQPTTSGYVPAPALLGPTGGGGVGAQIASGIPGAPPFLAGAINGVVSPAAVAPAQVSRGPAFDPLIGISALSAEQRIQKAELDRQIAERRARFMAQQQAEQQARARSAQLSQQRNPGLGGSGAVSGWAPPIY